MNGLLRARSLALAALVAATTLPAALMPALAPAAHAQQQESRMQVSAPFQASAGDVVEVQVLLFTWEEGPIIGGPVTLLERGGFMDAAPRNVPVAGATTGQNGVAVLRYVARRTGSRQITIEYDGDRQYAPASETIELFVEGVAQTYIPDAPMGVPGVNRFAIVAVISIVWSAMLAAVLHMAAIVRAGQAVDEPEGSVLTVRDAR